MLERIGLHQTRLKTPGLSLDGKGIALGPKGLLLVSTLDRLVAFLAVYTRERSLEDLVQSLKIVTVRSELGAREIILEIAAESSDRMDRIAETARLVGGFVFTGASRHFIQYRDAQAPFGYDTQALYAGHAPLILYHDKFTQAYREDTTVDLRSLLLRLELHVDPSTVEAPGPRFIMAERGLGPALIHYFLRSGVRGEVGMAEWPPETAFDDAPVQRYLFRIPELPPRMRRLMRQTPGIVTFVPQGPGVATQIGYRHPVALRACPLFDTAGLVLLRGGAAPPWTLERLPPMGELEAFARVSLRERDRPTELSAEPRGGPDTLRVPLRLLPTLAPARAVSAVRIGRDALPMLRTLAYALPRHVLGALHAAITAEWVVLRSVQGIESIPLGTFYSEFTAGIYVPLGYAVVPAVPPAILRTAFGGARGLAIFLDPLRGAWAVEERAFVPFETQLLESASFAMGEANAIELALQAEPIEWHMTDLPLRPLATASAPEPEGG